MYNSNITLYFLNEYIRLGELPERMVDVNIASDYAKIGQMLSLYKGEKQLEILETIVSGEGIITETTEKFNLVIDFGDKEMASMLYYLGYLTISESIAGYIKLVIPNKMMREIYSEYLLKVIQEITDFNFNIKYSESTLHILTTGKIDKIIEPIKEYFTNLSNRDY